MPGGNAGAFAGVGAGLGAGLSHGPADCIGHEPAAGHAATAATPPAPAAASAAAAPGAPPELLGATDLAKVLGVSEADVIASLEKGDLKGKKIGSTWRVTRAALDEFLKS